MRFRAAFVAFLFLLSVSASAQTAEADLSARLVGKPLFLRGFWAGDKLRFDASGTPQGHPSTSSFTLSGIRLKSVQLQGDTLHLEGVREGLMFEEDSDTYDRVPLRTGNKKPEEVKIEVKGLASQDFTPALHSIFAENLAELIPSMPAFWQPYAQLNFLHPQQEEDDGPDNPEAPHRNTREHGVKQSGAAHVGGTVKPPTVIHAENPKFTLTARQMSHSGVVEIYLWVEQDGSISHVSIARPAGFGLDEAAVAAIMKYRFRPATRDGRPVAVDLYIDVNFQIL